MSEQTRHLIIWDGECDLCRRAVDWVKLHDTTRLFDFSPFQTCPSPPMSADLQEIAECSVVVITDTGRRLTAGDAVLFILEEIGWHPRLVRLLELPGLRTLANICYVLVARHRPFFSRFMFREKH